MRDKMRLKQIVPQLESSEKCNVCKYSVVRHDEAGVMSTCCDRTFHHLCLLDVSACSYCNEALAVGGGLPCAVCGQPTVSYKNRKVFYSAFVEEEEEV